MTIFELREISLRFAVQSDRGDYPAAPEVIATRAKAYLEFMMGTEKSEPKPKAKKASKRR